MLLPLKEAARELGVPYASVLLHHKQNRLPVQRIGRVCAIEPETLRLVLQALGYTPRAKKEN